jgi:hypothetical protein
MREPSTREMLVWISRTYGMGPEALARMFQHNRLTIDAWLADGRISLRGTTKIRSSYCFLSDRRPPGVEQAELAGFIP